MMSDSDKTVPAYAAQFRSKFPDDEFVFSDAKNQIYVPGGHFTAVTLMRALKSRGATSFSDLTLTGAFAWAFGCTVSHVIAEVQVWQALITVIPVPTFYERIRGNFGSDPLPIAELVHEYLVGGKFAEPNSVAWAPIDWDLEASFPAKSPSNVRGNG